MVLCFNSLADAPGFRGFWKCFLKIIGHIRLMGPLLPLTPLIPAMSYDESEDVSNTCPIKGPVIFEVFEAIRYGTHRL